MGCKNSKKCNCYNEFLILVNSLVYMGNYKFVDHWPDYILIELIDARFSYSFLGCFYYGYEFNKFENILKRHEYCI